MEKLHSASSNFPPQVSPNNWLPKSESGYTCQRIRRVKNPTKKEKENIVQKGSLKHNSSAWYDKLKAVTFKNRELFHKSAQRMKSQI
jgi:hypothetical protein